MEVLGSRFSRGPAYGPERPDRRRRETPVEVRLELHERSSQLLGQPIVNLAANQLGVTGFAFAKPRCSKG